jgi:hypothetical protein
MSQGLPGSSNAETVLMRYKDAVIAKDWALAWAAAPVLEADCVPPPAAWPGLGLRSPPLLETVLRHLHMLASADSGEALLAAWPASGDGPEDACVAVLKHMQNQVCI